MSPNNAYAVVVVIFVSLWLVTMIGLSRCSAFHEDMPEVAVRGAVR